LLRCRERIIMVIIIMNTTSVTARSLIEPLSLIQSL
jgi:hypothetical protein